MKGRILCSLGALTLLGAAIGWQNAAGQRPGNPFDAPANQPAQQRQGDARTPPRRAPVELLARAAPASAVAAVGQPAGDGPCQCVGEIGNAADRIKNALAGPLHERGLEYNGTALEEVMNELSTEYAIPIQLDVQALDAAGQGPADPIRVEHSWRFA